MTKEIIADTESIAQQFALRVPRDRITVIWNGVDTREFSMNIDAENVRVVLGPRAKEPAPYYFPPEWDTLFVRELSADPPNDLSGANRVVLVSFSSMPDHLEEMNQLAESIAPQFELKTRAAFSFSSCRYIRANKTCCRHRQSSNRAFEFICKFFGLEPMDLELPFRAQLAAQCIEALSQLTGTSSLPAGSVVAELLITYLDGLNERIPLRAGIETTSWDEPCAVEGCYPVLAWHKRLALLDVPRYLESWRDFEPRIFAYPLALALGKPIQKLEIQPRGTFGTLYVWGLGGEALNAI